MPDKVAVCPNQKCSSPILADHDYDWCVKCGEYFPTAFKAQIPRLAHRETARAEQARRQRSAPRVVDGAPPDRVDVVLRPWFRAVPCSVSAELIRFGKDVLNPWQVTRIRGGIYRKSVNLIYNFTSMKLWVGDESKLLAIECTSPLRMGDHALRVFRQLHEALWRFAGARMAKETLERLASGERVAFGRWFQLDLNGAWFWNEPLFRSGGAWVVAPWGSIRLHAENGELVITSSEPRQMVTFSYRDTDNTEVLEAVLRFLLTDGNHARLRGVLAERG